MIALLDFLTAVARFLLRLIGVCMHEDAMTEIDHATRIVRLRCPNCNKVSPGWQLDNYRERGNHNG